jgi:hypothetical protein
VVCGQNHHNEFPEVPIAFLGWRSPVSWGEIEQGSMLDQGNIEVFERKPKERKPFPEQAL